MRKQVTVQIHHDRHPNLYKRYFLESGERNRRYNAAEEIPLLADKTLTEEVYADNTIIEKLDKIESMISNLRTVGVIDDEQEVQLKERANDLIGLIPIDR